VTQSVTYASVGTGLRSSEIVDGELRLVLNNSLDAIEDGRVEIIHRLAPLALSARVINRLEVVFEELISNIIRHGFETGSDQAILVLVGTSGQSVDLTIEDDGLPFDPCAAPPPGPLGPLETVRLGGLGIPVVLKLAASLRYEAVPTDAGRRELDGRAFQPRNRICVSIATAE
jgi:serine/threonine-protein kinase RsbW